MNRIQQIVIFLGLLVVTGFCLRPPYQWENTTYLMTGNNRVPYKISTTIKNIDHRWIWSPPEGQFRQGFMPDPENDQFIESSVASVDWPRLSVYVGLTAAITLFGAFVIAGKRKG